MIRKIEQHSLLSIPALVSTEYDGWIIREAKGHTKRGNSVNFMSQGTMPVDQKIKYCEEYYTAINQPYIFRITPLAFPEDLDTELENRGYRKIDATDVCIRDLTAHPPMCEEKSVHTETQISTDWVDAMAHLTGLSDQKKGILTEMFEHLTYSPHCGSIRDDDEISACGLGVLSEHIIGLFEFATAEEHQRKGYAKSIVESLLKQAITRGAKQAYMQVVQSNVPGQAFWKSMGFKNTLYSYHYRMKP